MKIMIRIIFIGLIFLPLNGFAQEKSKNHIFGEISTGTRYHGFDVGGNFYQGQVFTQWVSIQRDLTPKTSIFVNFWGQFAPKKSPNGAEEFDIGGGFARRLTESVDLTVSAANFKVHNMSIQKWNTRVNKNLKRASLSAEVSAYTVSRPDLTRGGVVAKVTLSSSAFKLPKRFAVFGSAGISGDNGPFHLGGPASILFLTGRVERPINSHWTAFANVKHSRPLFGDTVRTPLTSGNVGVSFRY